MSKKTDCHLKLSDMQDFVLKAIILMLMITMNHFGKPL